MQLAMALLRVGRVQVSPCIYEPVAGELTEHVFLPGIVVPPRTSLKDSGYTSRGYVDVNAENCRPEGKCETRQRTYKQNMDPATDVLGNSDRGVDQVALLPPDIPAESLAPFTVKLEGEEDLWDENDKSLEIAMSQMDIPDPPSSQQGVRSQSASALNLPHPPARLLQPSHEGESKDWEGFKSRDKRVREKSSDSSNASVSKLSSKPLVASQNKQQKPMKLESNDSAFTACSPTSVGKAEPVRDFSKSISASSDKLRLVPTRPVMASARSCGSNTMTAPGLSKKFKCPTITNTAAARAEQEKKAAAAAKLVQRAGQPLPAEEAWMEDMDWNVDDSF